MKHTAIVLVATTLISFQPCSASAQPLSGFSTFTINSDVNGQRFPGASGGALIDLPGAWVSAGMQADLFVSWPYFAGRYGPFGQLNVLRRGPVRLFAIGGYSWGEQAGPMIGAGFEFWTGAHFGFRATVQDYLVRIQGVDCTYFAYDRAFCEAELHGGNPWVGHQPTLQLGVTWR